ncbi:MAG: M18 family aminopeptidase [Actinomycetota bacterium]
MSASPTSSSSPSPALSPVAAGVLSDLDASPSPYHAVARSVELLEAAGFASVDPGAPLPDGPGRRYVVFGGSIVAWAQPERLERFVVAGAHTDSPNFRVRTRPDVNSAGYVQVGVEVYGGVLLNSWLDRDLGLAGRVAVTGDNGIEHRLYREHRPVLRIPQLAIHLDREIRSKGLLLDPQSHITPMWALGEGTEGDLRAAVATDLGVEPDAILSWDLMTYDVQPAAVVGRDEDLFASGRIDNLVSAFCGVRALNDAAELMGAADTTTAPVLVLSDHEEVGSESATGAAGPLLSQLLERIAASAGLARTDYLATLPTSLVVSADGAHATHPNYAERHEPSHRIALNAGVVIKRNANQRYATDATSEALVVDAARRADVPLQYYIHRNDLPCGSTIGPITAARLGVPTVDLGVAQLAMHSAREMAGLADLDHLHALLRTLWTAR